MPSALRTLPSEPQLRPGDPLTRYAPPPARRAVPRPELFARLDEGVQGPLTLVTGPAGAGKTLVLSSWLAERVVPGPAAWLSLEPAHGRPGRFWGELLAIVHNVAEGTSMAITEPALDGETDPVESFSEMTRALERPL